MSIYICIYIYVYIIDIGNTLDMFVNIILNPGIFYPIELLY